MTVIVLTHGGAEPLIERLCATPGIRVAGVFVETEVTPRRSLVERLRRSIRYDGYASTLVRIARRLVEPRKRPASPEQDTWASLEACAAAHGVPIHRVSRYEAPHGLALMAATRPDLGVTWGTNILKAPVFQLPRLGMLNLHQGLTPYYRGGAAGFWELFNGESHGGLTVHFVAADVDAGDIVLQERVPLVYDYATYGTAFERFLADYRAELRQLGADLLVEAVAQIAAGTATRRPQDTTIGRRYRLPTHAQKDELRRRLRARQAATTHPPAMSRASAGER